MSTASFPYDLPTDDSLPGSRLCGNLFAEKDPAIAQGVIHSEKFVDSYGGTAPRDTALRQTEDPLRSLSAAKGNRGDISFDGQESNATTRRLASMNLASRCIEATGMRDNVLQLREAVPPSASEARDNFGPEHADTFSHVQHLDLRALF